MVLCILGGTDGTVYIAFDVNDVTDDLKEDLSTIETSEGSSEIVHSATTSTISTYSSSLKEMTSTTISPVSVQ